jgi:hypothetical protein
MTEFTKDTNVFDIKIKVKIAAKMLADSEGFRKHFKNLQGSGYTWLVLRHTTNRKEGSEGFVDGFASNLIEIEETLDGLVFSKFKALDIYPGDKLELNVLPGLTFSSYGMLYDVIEEALSILCNKEFNGEEL